jgi:8-oxo-dGTP diphosphatase
VKIHFIALTLQETAAFAVVLLALGYIAWRLVRFVHRKGMPECRCCQSCSAESPKKVPVTLNATKVIIPDDPGRRGVVGIAVRNGRMLVIRRSRSVVAPLVYCFPGGGIEEGESEEEALVREFQEEIGITIRPLRRVWHCVTAWKVDLAWWLVDIPPEALPVATPAEVESIHWYTPAEMAQLPDLLESNREFLEFVEKSGLFSDTQ